MMPTTLSSGWSRRTKIGWWSAIFRSFQYPYPTWSCTQYLVKSRMTRSSTRLTPWCPAYPKRMAAHRYERLCFHTLPAMKRSSSLNDRVTFLALTWLTMSCRLSNDSPDRYLICDSLSVLIEIGTLSGSLLFLSLYSARALSLSPCFNSCCTTFSRNSGICIWCIDKYRWGNVSAYISVSLHLLHNLCHFPSTNPVARKMSARFFGVTEVAVREPGCLLRFLALPLYRLHRQAAHCRCGVVQRPTWTVRNEVSALMSSFH